MDRRKARRGQVTKVVSVGSVEDDALGAPSSEEFRTQQVPTYANIKILPTWRDEYGHVDTTDGGLRQHGEAPFTHPTMEDWCLNYIDDNDDNNNYM